MLYNRVDATGKWQGWISMGGIATSSPSATVLNGSIWVMVRGTDGALYYKSWSTPEPPVPAVAWTRIPGVFSSSPAIVADGNRIHLFVRGPDLDILYSPYDGTQWGEFASLGGLATSSPAVGMVSWMKDIPSHLPAGLHGPPMQREAQALFVFIAGPGDKILYSAWYSEFSIAIAPVSTNWEAVPGF